MGKIEYEAGDEVREVTDVDPSYDQDTDSWTFVSPDDIGDVFVPRERVIVVETAFPEDPDDTL